MHAVAGVPVLCSSCEKGKERKSKDLLRQGRERERGKAAKDKQRKQFDSPTAASFACIGAKHVAQSKQIAREKQIASSKQSTKHDVVRRRSKARSTSTNSKQSMTPIEVQHDAEAKQLGGGTPSCILQGSGPTLPFFLPRTPPRTLVSTSRRRRPSYACASRSTAAGSGRDCPF